MKNIKFSQDYTTDSLGISRTTLSKTQISLNKALNLKELRQPQTDRTESNHQTPLAHLPELKMKQTKSQRKIGQRLTKKCTRQSDFFNVYKAPETLQTNSDTLKKQSRIYKMTQYIIQQYNEDLKAIRDSQDYDEATADLKVSRYLTEAWLSIEQLIQNLTGLLAYKFNRQECEQQMKEILLDCFKQKNICVHQRILYIFGKIEQLFYNPIQGAIYFKICKRLSDTDAHYSNKMKAYRGLGECLLRIYPKLSQLYFTKYLMAAWKLKQKNDELLAYELLGKYYFYVGQIEKAKLFHERMINGNCEDENSRVRLLALSRLEQGSLSNKINKDHLIVDIEQVSSDDECYEIVFPQKSDNIQQKYYVEKYFQKKIPDIKIIKDEANLNIRQTERKYNSQFLVNENFEPFRVIVSNPHQSIGSIKDKVLMSHMTPNRKLEMYQYIALASDKTGFNNSPRYEGLYNKYEGIKFNKIINRTIEQFNNIQQWIVSQEKTPTLPQPPIRRKGYFLV
ncbi:unnamed protein product (macronuclear) [Paramecium tetraurelia]|uniref:PCI domain-containing protein n=1 Tax=Paramecium tetraurelia TaxID=5888 RepID=A0CFP2_PARTE|nr:uncharacterized protein GSPATT00038049001 [Paramecium tetraurelia]CAK69609.1 unnamed protein product [Paramecium tetraurelia]|eukprot:XP_001437006.1 hypothetical protein (macronuclear) [Paramecium tetraurelia strain d4-2]